MNLTIHAEKSGYTGNGKEGWAWILLDEKRQCIAFSQEDMHPTKAAAMAAAKEFLAAIRSGVKISRETYVQP